MGVVPVCACTFRWANQPFLHPQRLPGTEVQDMEDTVQQGSLSLDEEAKRQQVISTQYGKG